MKESKFYEPEQTAIVGNRIAILRQAAGLTQKELSDRAGISSLWNIEAPQTRIKKTTLIGKVQAVARVLRKDPAEILAGLDAPETEPPGARSANHSADVADALIELGDLVEKAGLLTSIKTAQIYIDMKTKHRGPLL